MRSSLLLSLLALVAVSAEAKSPKPKPILVVAEPVVPVAPPISPEIEAKIRDALKPDVDPCQDFYSYACGGWIEKTPLPADRISWVRSFSSIDQRNEELIKTLLEDAMAQAAAGTATDDVARIGHLYGACMDEAAVEAAGTTPLNPHLAKIAMVKNAKTLASAVADLQLAGANPFFGLFVDADFKDPNKAIMYVGQAGLSMPDRDYYLREDAEAIALREKYLATMTTMLGRIGEKKPEKAAASILAFETELAKIQKPADELQDPDKIYNKLDLVGLEGLSPKLGWTALFNEMGIAGRTDISVTDPEYFKALDALITKTGPKKLQPYLRWHLLSTAANTLPKVFVDDDFDFYGRALLGQKEQKVRWKRCVDATTGAYPEIVGRLYVDKAFAGNNKATAVDLIQRIEASFERNLPELAWMDDATRAQAIEKAKVVTNKIGYPDHWRDYSSIPATAGSYFDKAMAAHKFEIMRQLNKIGQPSDRSEWFMSAADVNAYYNPTFNEMAFPAGILQSPFFDAEMPAAFNYGAIGMVMGHELTHGFDDSGRKFDGSGQLREWWAPEVAGKFEAAADCVVAQYNEYEVRPGLKVNGELTLGENIADAGGLKQAYLAYKQWESEQTTPQPQVAGFSTDQQFFVSFAQSWCSIRTPEAETMYATVDPHSPPKFRVNGAVSQFPAFATAFGCKEGTAMNPPNRCTVW